MRGAWRAVERNRAYCVARAIGLLGLLAVVAGPRAAGVFAGAALAVVAWEVARVPADTPMAKLRGWLLRDEC